MTTVVAALAIPLAGVAAAADAGRPPLLPYKDVSLAIDPQHLRIATQVRGGAPQGLPEALPVGVDGLVWAFAVGECGDERWGAFDTESFARTNVTAFATAGVPYIVSTGGEAGSFTCGNDDAMAHFIARYDSPLLIGLDFDIERQQTDAQIDSLVQRSRTLLERRPGFRVSFTVATHAAADGSRQSLNLTGESVVAALRRAGLLHAVVINLMVMNYGPAQGRFCVVRDGRCDMGRSAIQAADNVHQRYGVPLDRIAITVMLGQNDVAGNVFDLADARRAATDARSAGLAGLHFWSLDRDRPCAPGEARVLDHCHGLPDLPALEFSAALSK